MPLFSYHCPDCDNNVELLVGASESPACPGCGGTRMERQMSRIAPEGKSRAIIQSARAQAGREGHLSNFSAAERKR
ncbi:zinc ribbon domain-containing protein [Xanthobacter autotrophicus DSM 431]|uniref:FmdB family zinc ribbon protein n=1 Tax=Xanthobacter nonsaccharivorans TaxID=3119912 RepID=UPI00372C810E